MKRPLLTAVLAASSVAARAATNDIAAAAQVVTVYASRIEETLTDMPAHAEVYDARAVEASGARSLGEFLTKKANLTVRTITGNPLQTQLAMRGFGENSFGRVKVLLDGEELNSLDMDPPNLLRVPLGDISRIEVIHGPSPVLHGDGAVAGVVNVRTDETDATPLTRISAKSGSQGTFGANAQTRGGIDEDGIVYSAAADYTRSDGDRARSGYDIYTANGSLRKNFTNGSTVGLKANYSNALYDMPGALSWDAWKRDPTAASSEADWCRIWNMGVSLDSKAHLADDQWLFFDASFAMKHRHSQWGDYGYANDYDLYSTALSPRYVNETPVWGFDNTLTAGIDFRYDHYVVKDRSGWSDPNPLFDRFRTAVYLQDEFFVTDELSAVAGARLEDIDNRWRRVSGLADTHSNDLMGDYELALVYRPLDGLKTYLKGTRFHRSAFCDELNYTQDGRFLEPETGWSLDLGIESRFAEEFAFSLNGYGMLIDDEIFYNPHAKDYGGGAFAGYNCNSPGRTRRLGFDTGLTWQREKTAEASVKYGFVDAGFVSGDYDGCEVPLVPRNTVRAEVGYWLWDDLEVKGGYRFVGEQRLSGDFANDHDGLACYSLFDVGAVYEPLWAEGWKLTFVMDNLLDRSYCDFAGWSDWTGGYYYPACGRSFLFTLSYTF